MYFLLICINKKTFCVLNWQWIYALEILYIPYQKQNRYSNTYFPSLYVSMYAVMFFC